MKQSFTLTSQELIRIVTDHLVLKGQLPQGMYHVITEVGPARKAFGPKRYSNGYEITYQFEDTQYEEK